MLVGEPKFHSWGRCTIALTTMHSDLPTSGLCINLVILYYVDPLFHILGCNYIMWVLYFASWGVIYYVTCILYLASGGVITSITAPQDAHKRLVLQVAQWLTAGFKEGTRHELTT